MEDQPLPVDASPTTLSPGYIVDFDPKEDEEDPADHLVNGGDNDDNESFEDDDDDDDDVVKDEEEEEYLASADLSAVAENARSKRKWEDNHNGSSSQQNKGHKVPRAHTTRPISKKAYVGSLPLCNQCKFPHNGPCTLKCGNCKNVGHIIQNCKTLATTRNQRTRTCYECGSLRHYKSECPIVKFQKCVDMIHRGLRASKPKTMQDAIEFVTKLMDKKISTPDELRAENKRKLITLLRTIRTHNSRTRGKILAELTLQGTRRRNITADLSRCVLNVTTTMMVHVLPNAISATELSIWPVIIGVLQMPILLTTKGALGQVRRLLAMNVGIKGTTGMIARSERTKTMKTKLEVLEHVEWWMPLEEEKPNKTLTTLRMRSTLKRESCLACLVNPKLELS
ncbi:reverse transcriptase domain-containing protein [Tanacetum coccineum]